MPREQAIQESQNGKYKWGNYWLCKEHFNSLIDGAILQNVIEDDEEKEKKKQ